MSRATRSRGKKDDPVPAVSPDAEKAKTKAQKLAEKKATKKGAKKLKDQSEEESEDEIPVKSTAGKGTKAADGKRKRAASNDKDDKDQGPAKKGKKDDIKDTKDTKDDSKPAATDDKKEPAKPAAKQPAKEDVKKIVMTGKAPVDEIHTKIYGAKFHVVTDNNITYASTLNQSNVTANNNKFYILQVLQATDSPNNYYFWSRWGRVGVEGQNMRMGPMMLQGAIHNYNSKLRDKSVKGDYRVVEMNYEEDDKDKDKKKDDTKTKEDKEKNEKKDYEDSKLPASVKDLIRLIFDMKMVDNQMKEIGYDSKKMPLGKLAKSSITKGYEALKLLMDQIKAGKKDKIPEYSNDFYSYIPHDFGFQKMSNFILDTEQKVKAKLQMLQSLEDIQIFTKLLDEGKVASDMNEIDSNYLKLAADIEPLDRSSEEFKAIHKYLKNTHASTHSNYRLDLVEAFKMSKDNENARYTKDIGNKMLLWHGSRLTNFVGIISQGLRIAPPEAPVTGYMFGKGVYFADMVSKSANYCFTNKQNNTGLMLLCEVALGDMNEKFYADYYASNLPPGKMSTKGMGKTEPESFEMVGDVKVPNGLGKPTNIPTGSLLYNEFIVYKIEQIRMKYLLRLNFIYNY